MDKVQIRQILCPTDFSAASARAFEPGIALAAWYGATATVLHVLPEPVFEVSALPYALSPVLADGSRREAIEADLSSLVAPVNRAGLHAVVEVRDGSPGTEIVRAAQELDADLVVMGTHGHTGFQRWEVGSVAETVLRRAPCPVLTVPPRPAGDPDPTFFKRILCATDFSAPSEAAVRYAASLAAGADGSLFLTHVLDQPEPAPRSAPGRRGKRAPRPDFECAARAQLRRAVPPEARASCPVEEIVTTGNAATAIVRLAAERQAGLIVMGVHGRSVQDLMAFGSVAHGVVRQAQCPVLTVRATSR